MRKQKVDYKGIHFDPDASKTTWETLYKKVYTKDRWSFWQKFDYENLEIMKNRLYAKIKIDNNIHPEMNAFSKFKMSGDTDFNFSKDKKTAKKYECFARLLKRDFQGAIYTQHLQHLDACNKRYHELYNFSFMPMTGNLQGVKQVCAKNDRLDSFVTILNDFYDLQDETILSKATLANRNALKTYLKLFEDIYAYCSRIYFLDDKEFVKELIKQGKLDIDSGQRVVDYMDLAERFWEYKKERIAQCQNDETDFVF